MHRKILQQSVSISKQDEEQKFEVEYYLIESERTDPIDTLKESCMNKAYGIEIIKKLEKDSLVKSQKESFHESELIFDFSSSKSRTKSVIEKLAENTVTPISLRYVIEDILGE